MPTLMHAESLKIVNELNFLAFLHCHILRCIMPRPVKFFSVISPIYRLTVFDNTTCAYVHNAYVLHCNLFY